MANAREEAPGVDRYSRQIRFAPFGEEGQARLAASTALVCGCGALGSVLATMLARAGVGRLRIVDRDFVELSNLQRQVLFDEQDVADNLPKAVAAAAKLRKINSAIEIEPIVADVDYRSLPGMAAGAGVIVDGTDNFETRFLINDYALKEGVPWVYGGCIGAEGQTMTILPGETACLRCLMPDVPPPGTTPTCDTAGILGPAVGVVASLQACEALKILSGNRQAVNRGLTIVELWENRVRQVKLDTLLEEADCAACKRREFTWLTGERGGHAAVLCGRNAVQISPDKSENISLDELAAKLSAVGRVSHNRYLLRLTVDGYVVTVFPDGRAIVGGTDDPAEARTVYARYVGV